MAIAVGRRTKRWTSHEVETLVALGAITHPERYVLLNGELVEKMAQNEPHMAAVRRGLRALQAVFGEGYVVDPGLPLKGLPDSQPEPDLCVKRGSVETFDARPALPDEIALVLEIADSSLAEDRGEMARIYARLGVSEYWIVNLRERTLEVRRAPRGEGWDGLHIYREGERAAPEALPGSPIAVSDLLPPA